MVLAMRIISDVLALAATILIGVYAYTCTNHTEALKKKIRRAIDNKDNTSVSHLEFKHANAIRQEIFAYSVLVISALVFIDGFCAILRCL